MIESDRPQMTIQYGACWITKATDTHSEYVRVIVTDFPRQQWLRESASMLRYTYIAYLV
jgi:hypothetical protein